MTAQGAHTGQGRGWGAARALGPEAGQAGPELQIRLAQEVGRSPKEVLLASQEGGRLAEVEASGRLVEVGEGVSRCCEQGTQRMQRP